MRIKKSERERDNTSQKEGRENDTSSVSKMNQTPKTKDVE